MFATNLKSKVVKSIYKTILRNSRKKYGWKPCYINPHINTNINGNTYIHCIWEDTVSKRTIYNVCDYPFNNPNTWVINYLSFVKKCILNHTNTIENIEKLFWIGQIHENSLHLKKAILSSYSKL